MRGEPLDVHRFFEAVSYRLLDERVIGHLPIARNVLETGGGVGKHRRHQILRLHPLQLRWYLAAATGPGNGQRDGGVPSPARLEHRRVQERLHQNVAHCRRMQISEHVGERERVLFAERQQQRILRGGSLQLEVELTAEALPQRQCPGLVDAAAERRVQHQLHAA